MATGRPPRAGCICAASHCEARFDPPRTQSAPENALANYLSALDCFKAGQTDQAVQELIAASDKPQFQDYSLNSVQDDEETYLAAGYSEAEAAAVALGGCRSRICRN